jgi:hypothetical protein
MFTTRTLPWKDRPGHAGIVTVADWPTFTSLMSVSGMPTFTSMGSIWAISNTGWPAPTMTPGSIIRRAMKPLMGALSWASARFRRAADSPARACCSCSREASRAAVNLAKSLGARLWLSNSCFMRSYSCSAWRAPARAASTWAWAASRAWVRFSASSAAISWPWRTGSPSRGSTFTARPGTRKATMEELPGEVSVPLTDTLSNSWTFTGRATTTAALGSGRWRSAP